MLFQITVVFKVATEKTVHKVIPQNIPKISNKIFAT